MSRCVLSSCICITCIEYVCQYVSCHPRTCQKCHVIQIHVKSVISFKYLCLHTYCHVIQNMSIVSFHLNKHVKNVMSSKYMSIVSCHPSTSHIIQIFNSHPYLHRAICTVGSFVCVLNASLNHVLCVCMLICGMCVCVCEMHP